MPGFFCLLEGSERCPFTSYILGPSGPHSFPWPVNKPMQKLSNVLLYTPKQFLSLVHEGSTHGSMMHSKEKMKESVSHSVIYLFATPWTVAYLRPWDSPGKNAGVGCHALFQGIFLTQGWKLYLLHWHADSLPTGHQGSPN